MKYALVFATVLAVSAAQFEAFRPGYSRPQYITPRPEKPVSVNRVASNDQIATIIKYDNEINPDGSYRYAFNTDNGIGVEAQGTPRDFGGNPPVVPVVSQGSFSYTSPEGQVISVTYISDENGFQPQGDVLPTPPPIPEPIVRALEYIAKYGNQKK